ncbi:MAG: hypothetical protein LBQ01_03355 [Prevotellaceae bacterium]|jgi:predicted transcriptional regulator|nr:hypothetical protein [Prevotellaceae bacterium]
MNENLLLSKTYASEVVGDYSEILTQVDEIIEQTGYKRKFIAERMGIPVSTFYRKKRKKSFTVDEMQQLVDMMSDDDEIRTVKELDEIKKSYKLMTDEEFDKMRKNMRHES